MVQSSVGPCPVVRSNHTQADHSRARGTLPVYTPRPGDNIPISVKPAHRNESVPTEEEVDWAVQRLQGHRSVFPYQMHANHLWKWLWEH